MSGVLCEACEGYFQSSEHLCGVKLSKEVEKLQLEIMARDVHPDFERGEFAGQDATIKHIALLGEDSDSLLARAVKACSLVKVRADILRQAAECLETASFKTGEPYDPEAAIALRFELCIVQARAERYAFAKEE